MIEKKTGQEGDLFAYPYGFGNSETDKIATRDIGMRALFTLKFGATYPGDSPYFIKRVVIHEDVSFSDFKQLLKEVYGNI